MTDSAKPSFDKIRPLAEYRFKSKNVLADLEEKFGPQGDLAKIYSEIKGVKVHKWHHYIPVYERFFGPWRNRPLRFLEIGVSHGGSLAMWRQYFGPDAIIFGIDINPDCAQYDGKHGQVRIGSQADPDFLKAVVSEMGGVDVILDDGSHRMEHIKASLETLFPLLSMGGTYMIEDLHTAYWKRFGGGLKAPENFFNFIRTAVDDLHHWYHAQPIAHPGVTPFLTGLHIHDSIVVLDKSQVYQPTHSVVG
jgi:cephalosporin hydroxylase